MKKSKQIKNTEKKILIRQYKGYKIHYKKGKEDQQGMFHVTLPTGSFGCERERDIIEHIDDYKNKRKLKAENAKKEKAIAVKNKNLMSKKYEFKAKEFQEFINKASLFNSEIDLTYKSGKLSTLHMDPANVALISCNIESLKKHIEPFKVRIQSTNLNLFFKDLNFTAKDKMKIAFCLDKNEINSISFDSKYGILNTQLLDDDFEDKTKIPNLKYKTRFTIPTKKFYDLVKTASIVGETIIMESKQGQLTISSEDEDEKQSWIHKLSNKNIGKNARSKYSVEYLQKKFIQGKTCKAEFNTDNPLKLTDSNGDFMILAPRIESD